MEDLLRAGIPLSAVLETALRHGNHRKIKESILASLGEGQSLQQSMRNTGGFNAFTLSVIGAGEASGNLDHACGKLREYYELMAQAKKEMLSALYYPGLIVLCTLFLLLFIIFYFVPSLLNVYGHQLSAMEGFSGGLISSLDFIRRYFAPLLLTLLGAGLLVYTLIPSEKKEANSLSWMYGLPLIGPLLRKQKLSEIVWSSGIILGSGIDLLSLLDILQETSRETGIQQKFQGMKEDILQGDTLTQSLEKRNIQDDQLHYFVGLAHETGDLAGKLQELSAVYSREIKRQIRVITEMIQPMLILAMVGVVATVILGVVLPLLDFRQIY